MADKREFAPAEGPDGVDRWTSNGYGLIIGGKKVKPAETTQKKAVPELDTIVETDSRKGE